MNNVVKGGPSTLCTLRQTSALLFPTISSARWHFIVYSQDLRFNIDHSVFYVGSKHPRIEGGWTDDQAGEHPWRQQLVGCDPAS